ncbi:MAG: glyoxalase [Micavibrio sp.]|nr:glyoxalase [Micavibrio sp.]|tara:strand:+ start:1798 stop:2652 length:855 start_codon:yes stop_codon:yes gene_type:complete
MTTPQLLSHIEPLHISSYQLVVKDLDMVSNYYQKVIGLTLLKKEANLHILGVDDVALLYLEHISSAQKTTPKAAGLFHTAYLVPSRLDLAKVLDHLIKNRYPVSGASDHLVSEALYLNDPEGNGIEIYVDRPHDQWPYDKDGVVMDTLPMDIEGILKELPPNFTWSGMPTGTRIGHIHLQVGKLNSAQNFYQEILGLNLQETYPGSLFFGAGKYHHHIATNIWNSNGASTKALNSTGLKEFTLNIKDEVLKSGLINRIRSNNIEITKENDKALIHDPWNIRIAF